MKIEAAHTTHPRALGGLAYGFCSVEPPDVAWDLTHPRARDEILKVLQEKREMGAAVDATVQRGSSIAPLGVCRNATHGARRKPSHKRSIATATVVSGAAEQAQKLLGSGCMRSSRCWVTSQHPPTGPAYVENLKQTLSRSPAKGYREFLEHPLTTLSGNPYSNCSHHAK